MKKLLIILFLFASTVNAQQIPEHFLNDKYEQHDIHYWFSVMAPATYLHISVPADQSYTIKEGDNKWIGVGDTLKFEVKLLSDSSFSFVVQHGKDPWVQKPTMIGVFGFYGLRRKLQIDHDINGDLPPGGPKMYGGDGSNVWPGMTPPGMKTFVGVVDTVTIVGEEINEPEFVFYVKRTDGEKDQVYGWAGWELVEDYENSDDKYVGRKIQYVAEDKGEGKRGYVRDWIFVED